MLIRSYKATGDLAVLARLYQKYIELIYAVCFRYLERRDEAQDAVMEVFQLVARKLLQHEVTNVKSWLYAVARNYCLMQLRSSSRVISVSISDNMQFEDEMHPDDEKEWKLQLLTKCMEKLSPEQQKSISLFYLEQKCYKEIAGILALEWNKVRSLIQNGRRNLKICMEQS